MAVDSAVDERGTLAQPREKGGVKVIFRLSEIKMSALIHKLHTPSEYLGGKR